MDSKANEPYHEIEGPEDPVPLTAKQREVYEYLRSYVKANETWPTYDELMDRFGWASPNSVSQMYKALVSRGWLHRKERGVFRFCVGKCPFCGNDLGEPPSD